MRYWSWVEWMAVALVAILVLCFVVALNSPSCEERGGRLEFSHFQPTYMPATKSSMLIPIYRCEGATDE